MRFDIFLFMLIQSFMKIYQSFNIDTNSPLIKSIPSSEKSLFGFSLSVFSPKNTKHKYILVGSPTAKVPNSNVNISGAFYSCPLTQHYQDCIQRIVFEKSQNSLFGYTIDSRDDDNAIYTCAPRFLNSLTNVKYVEGNCWELNDQFVDMETISNRECVDAIKQNPREYTFRNCLTGGSVKSLGNKEVLVTAPYSYDGRGLLINSRYVPDLNSRQSSYLRIDGYMSKNQLTGLSMAIGNVIREKDVRTVVLGAPGMPQSNLTNLKMGFGQVMLVKSQGSRLSFHGLISGDAFGSSFGYSVLTIDVNNDGYDELVVGAPFTGNNRGKVFVFWNQQTVETNAGGYSFHLSLKDPIILQSSKKTDNGQFGNCLENIGDINKDSFLDLAVGAPFEDDGRGSIYIYLGSYNRRLVLSQKIDASKIDINFRGFGFSIFGRNVDIDENNYSDIVVGAAVSGHVIGLRARPLVKIYAENMLPSQDYRIPYNLESLPKCNFEKSDMICVKIKISIFYYYPHSVNCPANKHSILVNFTVDLDRPFLNSSNFKRVYFGDRSNVVRDVMVIECKPPSMEINANTKYLDIIFQNSRFFNFSRPIDINLKWSMTSNDVPIRKYQLGDPLEDLSQYPVMDMSNAEMSNKILFGAGCTPESCKPILQFDAELSLIKKDGEYTLYIGNSSSFTVKVNVKNVALSDNNRAFNTFIKIDYPAGGILSTGISLDTHRSTSTGIIYAVPSPLEVNSFKPITFNFTLSNDFLQNSEKYIYLNISLDAMVRQPHLQPIVIKIRILMVANIEMKVSITHIDHKSYQNTPILGISAISDEQKIGPRLKIRISISNNENASVVLSSKLVIYFPWEVSGDPNQMHGQYLLYLQHIPKFHVIGGKRKISCDFKALKKLVNPIGTKLFRPSMDSDNTMNDVSIANVSLPKKTPQPPPLIHDLLLIPDHDDDSLRSDWHNYVLLDCMNGSARCVPLVCDLGPLSRQSGEINIELDLRIWIHTFVENFIRYKYVQTEIPIFWVPESDYDIVLKNPDNSFKSVGIKTDNLQKPKAPPSMNVLWSILVASVVGAIFLAIIVTILYKCNFFRRKRIAVMRKRPRQNKEL